MAEVLVHGKFMGSELKTQTFEGVTKNNLYVDIYQPQSTSQEKTVTLKTDDISMANMFNTKFKFGEEISVNASVNAYKNKAYFKLLGVAE